MSLAVKKEYWIFVVVFLSVLIACNKSTSDIIQAPPQISATSPSSKEYAGFRIAFVNLEAVPAKGGTVSIKGTVANTGRYKVVLPKNNDQLLVAFDDSIESNDLLDQRGRIKQALLAQSLILEAGEVANEFSIRIKKESDDQTKYEEELLVLKGGTELSFQDTCPDLQIDTFFVSKKTKKYAEISFKIVNVGKGPASLFGATKAVEDNVAIRAYASGTENLSRGDLIMGGAYIEAGLVGKKGILQPQETFAGAFRVDIRKKTRHMPYIIISIDDYQNLWECNEANNVEKLYYR